MSSIAPQEIQTEKPHPNRQFYGACWNLRLIILDCFVVWLSLKLSHWVTIHWSLFS